MDTYEIVSEVRGMESFLVVYHKNEAYLNEYLLKMIEYNSILGVLPVKSQNRNGTTILNYPLGNKFKLLSLIQQNEIDKEGAKIVYTRLIDAIMKMGEYFLNADQFLYQLEYLYVDKTLNPYLVYLPFENIRNQGMERVWREFFLNLLSYFAEGKQDAFYDKLMRYLIQPRFFLKEFQEFLTEPASEGSSPIFSVKDQLNQTRKKEETIQQEIPSNTGKTLGGLSRLPFSIPGKSDSSYPEIKKPQPENKTKPEKEEKKEDESKQESTQTTKTNEKKGIFSKLFGGKEKKSEKSEKVEKSGLKLPPAISEKENTAEKEKSKEKLSEPNRVRNYYSTRQEENNNIIKQAEKKEEQWSNSHFYTLSQEEDATVLAEEACATAMLEDVHLISHGVYIPISQFPFTIGKASANYIVVNPTVSRLHATISRQGNQYYIVDEHSKNHTYINGQMIAAGTLTELHEGDQVRLSNEEFTFHIR